MLRELFLKLFAKCVECVSETVEGSTEAFFIQLKVSNGVMRKVKRER